MPAHDGSKYFLTIVDQFIRCTWIYLLKAKSEVRGSLQNFCSLVDNQFETHVKIIRTDNRDEFQMPDFYQNKGIFHQLTCVATPHQNAFVGRKRQHILNVARALNFQSGLSLKYWIDFVLTIVYLIN